MGSRAETVVIGLNWVGDNILALPTYRALQHRYRAEGGIAVAAPENVASLLASSGLFKKVISWNGDTRERIRLLRDGRFRRAVILPNSFRAAMITFAAGIEERWGYSTDCRGLLLTHHVSRGDRGHQLDDYTSLLAAMSAPRVVDEIPTVSLPVAVREKTRTTLRALGIKLDRPLFGIHAGGLYGKAKHWGDDRYCEVAGRLRADGFDVVLLTSPGEREQAESIAISCEGLQMIGEDGDVLQLASAISHCSVIITNDSGPLHLAAALAVPSVSIFGPTDPGRTVIPGATRVIRKPIGCQPCYQRECPLRHHRCMSEITVDDVYTAAVGLWSEMDGRIETTVERRML
ncbi:MAG TPA: lipopolysaccharide heptosyltransferase II [Thermoanaerobaculia bacterium]|jgi:heptosyltransferase-2|nr:lipopolysaccharide heptosyltransferase II [Thermoanaerobaculia bacterium]